MQILLSMTKYIRKNWKLWLCGILLPAFFSMATNIYFARRLQDYVSRIASRQASFQDICKMLFLTLIVLILFSWMDHLGSYLFSLFVISTEKELRNNIYRSLTDTSLSDLQIFESGETLTRYNTDVEQCARIISHDVAGVVYPVLVGTGYLAAVLSADFRIGSIMLLLGVLVILLNFLYLGKIKRAQAEILQARDFYTSSCSDAIRGKMSIRQYSAKEKISRKIADAADMLYQKESRAVQLETLKLFTSDALANSCIYLLTPLACLSAALGYLDVSVVLFIHQLCRYFILYTQNFAVSFLRYSEHALSYERIRSITALQSETAENDTAICASLPAHFSVSFENVSVAYKTRKVLKDVSFTVSPGQCIGIIGESGSGKTTLIKALLQMTAYQGNICIGGENCKNISLQTLRECIAYSPEHSDLFPATVYENIRYGRMDATDEEIHCAARRAGIPAPRESFFQRHPGEDGDQLSGGQQQKVSIARALLKNAPIIVLDEPTAALDADSESVIRDTILALKREGKCILLITHKASTLHVADRILRIEEGKASLS